MKISFSDTFVREGVRFGAFCGNLVGNQPAVTSFLSASVQWDIFPFQYLPFPPPPSRTPRFTMYRIATVPDNVIADLSVGWEKTYRNNRRYLGLKKGETCKQLWVSDDEEERTRWFLG
jgi:hypothetical protein